MLEISFIKEEREKVLKGLNTKNLSSPDEKIEAALSLDTKRKELQTEMHVY